MKVVILQHRLLHYRLEFFELLREYLAAKNIDLELIHGQPSAQDLVRCDTGFLPWAKIIRNKFLILFGKELIFQDIPKDVPKADLVVMMQENRIVSNYKFLFRKHGCKIAFWGHGKNYQSTKPSGFREKWKKQLLHRVDWWFAYTDSTVDYLVEQGFDFDRITNLNNAIDTRAFKEDLISVGSDEVKEVQAELRIPDDAVVGLFCGSLYLEKKLDLLMKSADLVKDQCPDFHLVVIGDGPSAGLVKDFAKTRSWVHCTGVKKGHEKAILFKMANIQLNPGLVGLHVLDAFAAGLPMVTTKNALHSPEISYLKSGINGLIVESDLPEDYADAVVKLVKDKSLSSKYRTRCLADADVYTVENMAKNFSEGIVECLTNNCSEKGVR